MGAENTGTRPIRNDKIPNSAGQTINIAATVLRRSRSRLRCCGLTPSFSGGRGLLLSRLFLTRIRHHLQSKTQFSDHKREEIRNRIYRNAKSREKKQPWKIYLEFWREVQRDLGFGKASFSLGQSFVRQLWNEEKCVNKGLGFGGRNYIEVSEGGGAPRGNE